MNLYHRQHVDKVVGPKDYERFGNNLLVTDIFYTVQGEGPFAGCPAVFVRLAGCNKGDKLLFGCQFCDTEFAFDNGIEMSVADVIKRVEDARNAVIHGSIRFNHFVVVITGGEPMMQDNVWQLCRNLVDVGVRVQIESNGDRLAPAFLDDPIQKDVVLVVSPKIIRKKPQYPKLRKEVLQRADVFKFLVDHREASPYHDVPDEFLLADGRRDRVMISPLTIYRRDIKPGEVASFWTDDLIDREHTKLNAVYAAKLAMRHGLRISLQTHLLLSMP